MTRAVQFGSEPLYDNVLSAGDLTTQVKDAQANLSSIHIPVTISEMAYGYQEVRYSLTLIIVEGIETRGFASTKTKDP